MISGHPSRARLRQRPSLAPDEASLADDVDAAADGGARAVTARLAELRRLLPCTWRDACEARPDIWADDDTGHRRFEKDLARLDAKFVGGVWVLPSTAPRLDPRLLDPERIARARRDVERGRPPLVTDAAALVAQVDALLEPDRVSTGAQLLADWVAAQGFSLRRAAAVLGVPRMTLHHWTRGTRTPRPAQRDLLAAACGIPIHAWVSPSIGDSRKAA